jgi:hypothetical protein
MLLPTNLIFLTCTALLLVAVNTLFSNRLKCFHHMALTLGLLIVIFQFILTIFLIGFDYSEDLSIYSKWFESIAQIGTPPQVGFMEKGSALHHIFYWFSMFTANFSLFTLLIALYSLVALAILLRYQFGFRLKFKYLRMLLLLYALLLLNRVFLTDLTHIIRSYLGISVFLLALTLASQKNPLAILLFLLSFFLHKFQMILCLIPLIASMLTSYRILIILGLLTTLDLYLNIGGEILIENVFVGVQDADIYYSKIIYDGFQRKTSHLIQYSVYIVAPVLCILWNMPVKKLYQLTKIERFWIKYTMATTILFFLTANATPRSSRVLALLIILIYPLFIRYSTKAQNLIYANVVIIINYIALFRNLDKFII